MNSITNFRELLIHQLQDLHNNSKHMSYLLPKMSEVASSEELRDALKEGSQRGQRHQQHLRECLESLNADHGEETCRAMIGMIEEGNKTLDMIDDPSLRDAALVVIAQKMLHYEIAAYGSVKAHARKMNERKVVERVEAILKDEAKLDKMLSRVSEASVNEKVLAHT